MKYADHGMKKGREMLEIQGKTAFYALPVPIGSQMTENAEK